MWLVDHWSEVAIRLVAGIISYYIDAHYELEQAGEFFIDNVLRGKGVQRRGRQLLAKSTGEGSVADLGSSQP